MVRMMESLFVKVFSGVLCSVICYQTYINLPMKVLYGSEILPLPSFKEDSVVLIFPGFNGPDQNVVKIKQAIEESDRNHQQSRFTSIYDWTKWKGDMLRAAFNSKRIGKAIGLQLATRHIGFKPLKELHVIGISVGAFAADACVQEYKKQIGGQSRQPALTRLTLLDPFTSLGIFGQGYGKKHFGKNSDYCETFVNTDDPVPFTNDPLPLAVNFDITKSQSRSSYDPPVGDNMHSWPAAFYGLGWEEMIDPRLKNPLFTPSHLFNPRGSIVKLP